MASLELALSKMNWASEHLDHLWEDVTAYLETNPYRFVADPQSTFEHDGSSWTMGSFEAKEDMASKFSLQFGDVITNLRSSLDYLVWELVLAHNGKPTNSNAFPICDTVNSFGSELQRGRLSGVHPTVVSHIESLQPYHSGEKCHQTFFWVLHELNNINKHRRALDVVLKNVLPPADLEVEHLADGKTVARVNPPPMFKTSAKAGPYRIVEGDVQVDPKIMAFIAIQETSVEGFEACSLLTKIRD